MSLTQGESVLAKLRTLKAASLKEQARIIQLLAERNLDLYDTLAAMVRGRGDDRIFSTRVSGDRQKVVLAALLTVLASDIATLPGEPSRERHLSRLKELCSAFDIEYDDVLLLHHHIHALAVLLDDRPGLASSDE